MMAHRTAAWAAALAALAALQLPVGAGADTATDGSVDDVLTVQTYDWQGGPDVHMKTNVMPMDPEPESKVESKPWARGVADVDGPRRLEGVVGTGNVLDSLWNRPTWRDARFTLQAEEGEHPCFAGFSHMVNKTDRCGNWTRSYPEVGGVRHYTNGVTGRAMNFTLKSVVKGMINVWMEGGTTNEVHTDIAIKAARIYTNDFGIEELRPAAGSASWMEHECKVMGSMPFMYTCSDRINILVQECNMENAFVQQADYLRNFPGPANNRSAPNHDIVFYMCRELIDRNPNPYAAANTFAHELAHVIQGGFGFSFNTMTEGGATWLEGPLLNMPPRPMVYAWGFRDWNRINAAHIYANTRDLNARKFYQIHAMLLTYLAQPELLGDDGASSLQNYQTFEQDHVPWGRASYDYFLKSVGQGKPLELETVEIDVKDTNNAFATALIDFRVALAAQCIEDAAKRPTEPRYLMPASLRETSFWDCTSYPTYWSATGAGVESASMDIHYGGAAVSRLAMPQSATVSVDKDADPKVRTKVLAAGTTSPGGALLPAQVRELAPGESAHFAGAREIFVVQVNVDPAGETISDEERPNVWRRTTQRCEGNCSGHAWKAGRDGNQTYRPNQLSALRSPMLTLPEGDEDASLSFDAAWALEDPHVDGSKVQGCPALGYDGVQVRLHVYNAVGHAAGHPSARHHEGQEIYVLRPQQGYSTGPNGETALHSLSGLYKPDAACESFEGWTGRSSPRGQPLVFGGQRFSLAPFAGRQVRFELLFSSDGSVGGEGFYVDNIVVRSGGKVVFTDFANPVPPGDETLYMFEHLPQIQVRPGTRGRDDGVPVVAGLPYGHAFDRGLDKARLARSAPWSATWTAPASASAAVDPEALRRRAYLGWSYSAHTTDTKTTVLHPWQEACMLLEAPFRGAPKSATLFGLVDKIGVSGVSLAVREESAPYATLGGSSPVVSPSVGVEDPGTRRFNLTGSVPTLEAGARFLFCVGIASVKPLPADGDLEPFVHLPLTNVSAAGQEGQPGATFLRVVADHGAQRAGETSALDPWHGHTFVIRSEFVEAMTEVASGANGGGPGRRLRASTILHQ